MPRVQPLLPLCRVQEVPRILQPGAVLRPLPPRQGSQGELDQEARQGEQQPRVVAHGQDYLCVPLLNSAHFSLLAD